MTDSTEDTKRHIQKVAIRLHQIRANLAERADNHDASKLWPEEKPGYDILSEAMRGKVYGSDEYNAAITEARWRPEVAGAIEHHYAHNSHHPEFWQHGVADMSLLDILEMLADWRAASERSGGGIALGFQCDRFGISPQLAAILANTVRELGW